MITKLTDEQKARFPEFIEKWTRIGLCTDPANRKKSEKAVLELYTLANLKAPRIEWESSPIAGIRKALSYGKDLGSAFFGGSLWAGYASWADYFNRVCNVSINRSFLDMVENCGYYWTLDEVAILTERPNKIMRNAAGRLHCVDGMAIQYPDDWGIWSLNGVVVNEEIVMTPADKLDPKLIFSEKNAQVRSEIVRKIGIERVVQKIKTKVLDKKQDYELLEFQKIEGMRIKPKYLKMKNQSVGIWHVEGVPPEVTTVNEALAWRNGLTEWSEPARLT